MKVITSDLEGVSISCDLPPPQARARAAGPVDLAAAVPAELQQADDLLCDYGRWATSNGSRKNTSMLGRMYIREADPRESLEAWIRRRQHVPGQPLMPTPEAMRVQRALAGVPMPERVALQMLYIPNRVPIFVRLRKAEISPRQCRERHLAGLRIFDGLWKASRR